MTTLITELLNIAIPLFAISCRAAVRFRYTLREAAGPLRNTRLLPLGIALLLENLWPGLGEPIGGGLRTVTNISLIAVVTLTFVNNVSALVGAFGIGAVLAALLLLMGALVIGYAFGIFGRSTRNVVALNTAQRNYAAAMVVATETFANPDVLGIGGRCVHCLNSSFVSWVWLPKRYSPHPALKSAPKSFSIKIP